LKEHESSGKERLGESRRQKNKNLSQTSRKKKVMVGGDRRKKPPARKERWKKVTEATKRGKKLLK